MVLERELRRQLLEIIKRKAQRSEKARKRYKRKFKDLALLEISNLLTYVLLEFENFEELVETQFCLLDFPVYKDGKFNKSINKEVLQKYFPLNKANYITLKNELLTIIRKQGTLSLNDIEQKFLPMILESEKYGRLYWKFNAEKDKPKEDVVFLPLKEIWEKFNSIMAD